MLDVVARHVPGFGVYADVLDVQDGVGHGRIRASQEGLIFQHLLILRRMMVQDAGLNFYDVQDKSYKLVGKKNLDAMPSLASYLLVYAATRQVVLGDRETLFELRGML